MPIRPENKHLYPANWKDIRAQILDRAAHCCEWCSIPNYSYREKTKIVLTIAHLDHDPTNNDPSNLKAGCQKCHLGHDREHHKIMRSLNRYVDRERAGQGRLL